MTAGFAHQWLRKALLACGWAYALGYVLVNDVVAVALYPGYSRLSQAVSELSSTASPAQSFLTATVPVFSALMVAFGMGIWLSHGGRKALRVTGILLIAHGMSAPLWLLYPMTSRQEMIGGTIPANDLGHIVLSAATVLMILSQIGSSAAAFGKQFRVYAGLSAAIVLGFGAWTGVESVKIPTGDPTPFLGLLERIGIGAWLLWMAVLAVLLWKTVAPALRPSR